MNITNFKISTIFYKFSERRHQIVENQKINEKLKFRKNSLLEIVSFQYIPVILTNTLLAPLQRIKIILQCRDLLPLVDSQASTFRLIKGIES